MKLYLRDPVLIVIFVLLVLSIASFLLGYIHYPYGILVLVIFLIARVLHLSNQNKTS